MAWNIENFRVHHGLGLAQQLSSSGWFGVAGGLLPR